MMVGEIVTLTWPEMYLASYVATMRRIGNIRRRLRHRYGMAMAGSYEEDFHACQAEMAVAKGLNLYWSGSVGDYGAVDVGGLVEARAIHENHHRLILHPDGTDPDGSFAKGDADDLPFVLVCAAAAPDFRLCGWLFGHEGKQPEFWDDPVGGRPAFFIPQGRLHPIAELRALLREVYTAAQPSEHPWAIAASLAMREPA